MPVLKIFFLIPLMRGFIDLTSSLNYFIPDRTVTRKDKLDMISGRIQRDIWRETGIYSTVGMSNSNPLLAKLALDNEAKTYGYYESQLVL